MKKTEIDEHFVSYCSVKGELFFLNMEYLHQKYLFFGILIQKNDSWMHQDPTHLISIYVSTKKDGILTVEYLHHFLYGYFAHKVLLSLTLAAPFVVELLIPNQRRIKI